MSNGEPVSVAIDAMTREVLSGPDIYRPSRFSEELNERKIVEIGLGSFTRTVNQNYVNFLIVRPRHPQFRRLLRLWRSRPISSPRLHTGSAAMLKCRADIPR
jgi:hypothetical protein